MNQKICLTTLEYPPDVGGVGESAQRIAQMLLDLGYQVHVAVFRAVFRRERDLAETGKYRRSGYQTSEQDGVIVHRLQPAVRSTMAKNQDYLTDLYGQLESLQQKYKFDLLHSFFINETGFLTTLLAQENHLPVITSVRGADLHKHIFDPKQYAQITWTLARSSWVTFVSRSLLHRARILVPSITYKSSAFWNSIAPIDWHNLQTPNLVEDLRGTVIGSVGKFRDKKGLEYLLDSCQNLSQEYELTLLLVGDFVAKENNYWKQELDRNNFANRIVITGVLTHQEALAYLPYMDIFAIPSLHDGCPNALLEAMLASRAIVGTNVDAIGEILEDGIDSLLVDPSSSKQLEIALRELLNRPLWRQKLGAQAREKALQQLNPSVEKYHWQQVYQRVLNKPASVVLNSNLT